MTSGESVTAVNAALSPGAEISGTVTDAGTGAGVPGIAATAYDADSDPITTAITDSSGAYTIDALPVGTDRVGFQSGPVVTYAAQYYDDRASLSAADPISVILGSPATGIDAALTPAGSGGAPTVNVTDLGDQTGTVGVAVALAIYASDSDAGTLAYTATGLPAGLSIDAVGGEITGTPTNPGQSSVTVTATDASGPSGHATFGWTISPVVTGGTGSGGTGSGGTGRGGTGSGGTGSGGTGSGGTGSGGTGSGGTGSGGAALSGSSPGGAGTGPLHGATGPSAHPAITLRSGSALTVTPRDRVTIRFACAVSPCAVRITLT
ncbi:MAG: putative Ig domain-containing protein, partial [Solirubrobacteraceae bacterium]